MALPQPHGMDFVSPSWNLTQIEGPALSAPLNLCDGHARHSLSRDTKNELKKTVAETLDDGALDVETIERRFLRSLSARSGQDYERFPSYVVYSASVAIDVVAKFLASRCLRTGLILPAFDCLPALLRRGGVETVPVPEDRLMPVLDLDFLDSLQLGALFVVTPNNPTGTGMEPTELARLFTWAAERKVVLVLDLSFRLLDDRVRGDLLGLAEDLGTNLITIDDTGKVLSVFDTKVGVLASTRALGEELGLLQSEILLNVSSLDLRLLATVLAGGEINAVRDLVRTNRSYLRAVLSEVDPLDRFASRFTAGAESHMGVEWVRVGDRQPRIVRACWEQGLAVLPGEFFYWAGHAGHEWIRLALARDAEYFRRGADILAKSIAND